VGHADRALPASIDEVSERLRSAHYVPDRGLATSVFLALRLGKPLFLEGEAGVGKTEIAKVLATVLDRPLIRLQCYEGLDLQSAVYEWNYARQILEIRLLEARGEAAASHQHDVFTRDFLLRRPLLEAIDRPPGARSPVLLIDELDRADEEFEAFLLELLSDFQITIPELGTIRAAEPPIVVITSNRTREIHDALKRRCLYQWIDYPDFEKEIEIVRRKVAGASETLAREVVAFVQDLRREELFKRPGVAETLDWIMALQALDRETLSDEIVGDTLGVLLKYQDDVELVKHAGVQRLLERSRSALPGR
jgi:MoxR-like ATPase